MKKKLLHDLSANTLQVIINQLSGLAIFYVLSVSFSKNDFGEINWSLAILLTAFSILSLGIDQLIVKKVAEGIDASMMLSIYFVHVLLSGCLFYSLLLIVHFLFPAFHHQLLLFLGFGKMMIFFSSPFKQLANGLEKFRQLLYMSVCSNIIRATLLILFFIFGTLSMLNMIIIFITGDVCELILSLTLTKKILKIPFGIKIKKISYFNLVKEALPQAGVVVFTSAIARFDWIFLGIFASNVALAEYSFAFKVFEIASLPLLVIAPILIPRFSKMFKTSSKDDSLVKENEMMVLLRIEMIISSFLALMFNILWTPVMDFITHNKYGFVNRNTVFILSFCMPLLYVNNLLWTITFAGGKFKTIFNIFLITFLINISFDVILIPFLGGEGAAIAYLIAVLAQTILFFNKTSIVQLKNAAYSILLCPLASLVSGLLAMQLSDLTLPVLLISILSFFFILIITRQIIYKDWLIIKRVSGI